MDIIVGIDVGKSSLDAWKTGGKPKSFANTRKGISDLIKWSGKADLIVMEATGPYHVALADSLHFAGLKVSVVNPGRAVYYGRAMGVKNKTDKSDARILAEFATRNEMPLYEPPSDERRCLKAMIRQRNRIVERKSELCQLLQDPSVEAFEADQIREEQAMSKRHQIRVETEIRKLVRGSSELKDLVKLLRTIPGVGEVISWTIIAEGGDASRFKSAKAFAAFSGVQPAIRQSGTSMPGSAHMSKHGNAKIRKALYMGAMGAAKETNVFNGFYIRLLLKGKCKMSALGAVMHKMLRTAYGVMVSKTPFSSLRTALTNT